MNRSILIVICDFLLVSLLAFSTIDINKLTDEGGQTRLNLTVATNQVADAGKDLADVMRLALDEERKRQDQLAGELSLVRAAVGQREAQVQTVQKQLETREQEAKRLQQQQADLDRRQAELLQRFAAAQTNIQALNQQAQSTAAETLLSKQKLAAMEAEARKKTEEAAELQRQLALLAQSNQTVLSEKQLLASQLQLAQLEKRHASEQVAKMQDEVQIEREEKAKLAEGVKVLASRSGELAQEVRENRPLTPNTIFNEFVSNRVQAAFVASRSGLLGADASKRRESVTVLATDGTNITALCHVQDTPLTLWNPGVSWESLTGNLSRNSSSFPIHSLSFSQIDPRVVMMPVSQIEARQLGGKVYKLSTDPFKFQDAVLVGTRESYYGECRFEIDLTTPDYFKLDHNFLKGLFGKFNPSRGDLVFSKSGELLGVMANGSYCLRLQNLGSATNIRFGPDVRDQNTGNVLSLLYMKVFQLPIKLQ